MTITGQPPTSLLDSTLNADTTRVNIGVEVLKKAQDLMKQQGAAEMKMLEEAAPQTGGRLLDAYA